MKWDALRACEAFVLPLHQENFGISVVEAMAARRPVLISDQVNIWKEIVADRAGLVEEDTLTGTLALLGRWFELERSEREEMAARARGCFVNRFRLARAVSTIMKIFLPGPLEIDEGSAPESVRQ